MPELNKYLEFRLERRFSLLPLLREVALISAEVEPVCGGTFRKFSHQQPEQTVSGSSLEVGKEATI